MTTKRGCNVIVLVSPPSECEKTKLQLEMKCYCVVLLTLWPLPLTLNPKNSTTSMVSQGHFLQLVWTLWDHLFLSYAADRQTDKQTDSKILPMPNDIVGVGNYTSPSVLWHCWLNMVSVKQKTTTPLGFPVGWAAGRTSGSKSTGYSSKSLLCESIGSHGLSWIRGP